MFFMKYCAISGSRYNNIVSINAILISAFIFFKIICFIKWSKMFFVAFLYWIIVRGLILHQVFIICYNIINNPWYNILSGIINVYCIIGSTFWKFKKYFIHVIKWIFCFSTICSFKWLNIRRIFKDNSNCTFVTNLQEEAKTNEWCNATHHRLLAVIPLHFKVSATGFSHIIPIP